MKGSVLIADDEPLARRTLREHLRNLGWAGPIHEAHDGKTAITLANHQRPDLIFLDIVMPGAMNGRELAKRPRGLPREYPGTTLIWTYPSGRRRDILERCGPTMTTVKGAGERWCT